jgi:hypothetical protein
MCSIAMRNTNQKAKAPRTYQKGPQMQPRRAEKSRGLSGSDVGSAEMGLLPTSVWPFRHAFYQRSDDVRDEPGERLIGDRGELIEQAS